MQNISKEQSPDQAETLITRPFLSLCMIVKNELENLPRCLASAKPFVDEMVVVDTGSEDGTAELAAQYGARVDSFQWCNDFAAARNYALSRVCGEWVLVLDADEELIVSSDHCSNYFRQQLAEQPERMAYCLMRTEADATSGMTPLYHIRLFRNLPDLKYEGRFHEQLQYQGRFLPDTKVGYLESVRMLHHDRADNLQQKNISRNIPILEAARREAGLSLLLLYCLAGMYRDTQQPEKAEECYAEAFDRLMPHLLEGQLPEEVGFIPSLLFVLAAQALQQEEYETARLLCQRGLEWFPGFPPLNYAAAILLKRLGFPRGSIAYLEQCLALGREGSYYTGEPFEQNYMTLYPACELGAVQMALGNWTEAKRAFELALSFDPTCTIAQQNLATLQDLTAASE